MKKLFHILARVGITIVACGLFLLIRPDIGTLLKGKVRAATIERASPRVIETYLSRNAVRKLQIGAGLNNKPGWLNSDIEPEPGQAYLDASKRFPLPDRSFRYVYSEQVIEHITYEEGLVMLRESYRILEPGGRVRLATPNLDKFIQLFQAAQTPEMQQYIERKTAWHEWPATPDSACYILNQQLREWGHQFVYTPKLLKARMESVGFRDVKQFKPGESDDPALQHIEARASWRVADVNAYEAMIFEAVR